ncbi:MAG: hypothetical protein Q8N68_01820 [bacterium]|nr:hypothetical protein [bacterium]
MKKFFFQKNAGLTLIETTIAIFIVAVGIVGGLSLAVYSTSLTHQIEERTIAYYLAQEGIELVRAYRDSAWLSGVDIFTTSGAMSATRETIDNYYVVDCSGLLSDVSSYTKQLYIDPLSGLYQHRSPGIAAPYTRLIRKSTGADGKVVVIVSEVSWGNNKTVKLEEDFYNWRDF